MVRCCYGSNSGIENAGKENYVIDMGKDEAETKKSDHDIMFENCMKNAEQKMKEIETEYYFKAGGRNAGRLQAVLEMLTTIELVNKLKVRERIDKEEEFRCCYEKSYKTDQELFDCLDGHGKCMKSAFDVANKLEKERRESEQKEQKPFWIKVRPQENNEG